MTTSTQDIMKLSAETIRTLTIDAVQKANIGHPGMPMGTADLSVVLWSKFLKHNPQDPEWDNRDRFVLSAGHGSMLIYALLHLTGYDLSLDDIKDFRQWDSKTPGHPEFGHTVGVETTTGPLGQGITNAVGMALAEAHLGAKFNADGFNVVDHHTYCIASDGDLMEGISHEACALAGHLGLNKLVVLWDDNSISIDGGTDISMTEDIQARYAAYGWHVLEVNGHKMDEVAAAIEAAKAETSKPTLIACKTIIGYGSPNKAGTSGVHGSPLGDEELALTKKNLGWDYPDAFHVPETVYAYMKESAAALATQHASWNEMYSAYAATHPELAASYEAAMSGELPADWQESLPCFEVGGKMATRGASGKVLEAIAPSLPTLLGGSADLSGSNKTYVKGWADIQRDNYGGKYIRYGVREHGMGGIMNGMILHGGIRPYGGTFLVFSDYMRPSVRLAALMNQGVIYVWSHDSIGLGEDGPTHQPIEHLMSLRAIPNLWVVRPADANEVTAAWRIALERQDGPTAIVLTRQGVETLDAPTTMAARGGYIVSDSEHPQALIMATGSEVEIAMAAQSSLAEQGIATRVVSLPCWSLFDAQDQAYKDSVLPPHISARVSLEAGITFGWEKYVGPFGKAIGIDRYGASAPYQTIYDQLGITAGAVEDAVKGLVN